jgi:hypothetical protein
LIRGEQIRVGTSGKRRPYCKVGKMLDALARSRDVRGPYNIASYLKDVAGYEVSGQAVSKYLYGESWPRHAFIGAFTEALNLTSEERGKLVWVCTYGVFSETAEDKIHPPLVRLP